MKYLLLAFAFFFVTTAQAAPQAPQSSVWVTPPTASAGEPIELHAFIYNTEKQAITFTVSFRNEDDTEVASGTATIQPEVAKAVVGTWKQPKESGKITAVVTKALTQTKKDLSTLHGEIGSVVIGGREVAQPKSFELPTKDKILSYIGTFFQKTELFRINQAEYFARIRDEAREETDLTKLENLAEVMVPGAPGQTPEQVSSGETPDTMNYIKAAGATGLALLFNNKAAFYVASVLLLLFVLKFISGRF